MKKQVLMYYDDVHNSVKLLYPNGEVERFFFDDSEDWDRSEVYSCNNFEYAKRRLTRIYGTPTLVDSE